MRARFSRASLAILLASVVGVAGVSNAQQVRSRPIGALQVTGEVRVNDALISTDSTVFAGDRVRTGSDGVAAVSISGRGTLLLQPGSAVSFPDQAQFLADLEQGRVTLRSLPDTAGFQIRLGSFIAAPVAPAESISEIERAADGSFHIACRKGSVGLIEIDGARSLFLDANESVTILADGNLQQAEAPARAPSPTEPAPPQASKRKQAWLPWLLVGAGGAGAAAALAGRGSETRPPVSPSQP
jgi:hypothetical protein